MKRTIAIMMGLAVAAAAMTSTIAYGADQPAAPACPAGQGNKDCPNLGQGQGKGGKGPGAGQGQQHRFGQGQGQGKGKGMGPGMGQGKGFRGGPRDGSGPKRDGSCGQCPQI